MLRKHLWVAERICDFFLSHDIFLWFFISITKWKVPAWHGTCELPCSNLVTAGYQSLTLQLLLVSSVVTCVVSMCACAGSAGGIIFTSLSIAAITAMCRRDWEWWRVKERERRRFWEYIYKMRIRGWDKIVESLISLPVSPITNWRGPARSVLAVLLPLCYFERCNSAYLALGIKGRRGGSTELVSGDLSIVSDFKMYWAPIITWRPTCTQ